MTLRLRGFPARPDNDSKKHIHTHFVSDPEEAMRNPESWIVGENAEGVARIGSTAAEHTHLTTHKDCGEPEDPKTWSTPYLTGKGQEYFANRARGAHDQDPGNARRPGGLKSREQLQDRIVIAK